MRVFAAPLCALTACIATGCASLKERAFEEAAESQGSPFQKIDAYLGYFADRGQFSGMVAVQDGDSIVFESGYGMASYEDGTPHSLDALYRIGSITKMFTAAAVIRCQTLGLLSLEDRLSKYIPEYSEADRVTLSQALSNSSGIPDFSLTPWFYAHLGKEVSFDDFLAFIQRRRLRYEPGTGWNYSNLNFILAGEIVERVTGAPLEAFLRDQFWIPLGMSATRWDDGQASSLRATGHCRLKPSPRGLKVDDRSLSGAAGNVLSSPRDMLAWLRALDVGSALGEAERELMFKVTGKIDDRVGYGLGCWIDFRELGGARYTYVSHSGGVRGFSAMVSINRERHSYTVILANYRRALDPYKEEAIEYGISRLLFD